MLASSACEAPHDIPEFLGGVIVCMERESASCP